MLYTPELEALERAIMNVGSGRAFVAALKEQRDRKITPQAVSAWTRVPAHWVLDVEAISGVSRHELRPDIYGPPPNSTAVPIEALRARAVRAM